MTVIKERYTLFTRIAVFMDDDNRVFADPLWAKDLELHFDYIADFHICCPVQPLANAPENAVQVNNFSGDRVIALKKDFGLKSVARNLIPNFKQVSRAVRDTKIVHSDGAGWAFPLTFYIVPMRRFRSFRWIIVIESSFWMKPEDRRASLREWVTHHMHKRLLGKALRKADVRIFTQDGYRTYFDISHDRTMVSPAVWIDEDQIITDKAHKARVQTLSKGPVRLLFPARMVPEKGCQTVIDAIKLLEKDPSTPALHIDFIGTGPLEDDLKSFAQTHTGRVSVNFLNPVDYGTPFFALLAQYHAIVLGNLQDEQPRVVFDAFSQGVPVISTDTTGVRDVVKEGHDALLYKKRDANGLAQQIMTFVNDPALRETLMNGAHDSVQGYSHSGMHKTRAEFLARVL